MSTDLWMPVATGLLSAAIPLVYGAGRFKVPGGIGWVFGNRETPLEVEPWVGRAVRAHRNLTCTAGLIYVRTAVFFVGVAGGIIILVQLFQ